MNPRKEAMMISVNEMNRRAERSVVDMQIRVVRDIDGFCAVAKVKTSARRFETVSQGKTALAALRALVEALALRLEDT